MARMAEERLEKGQLEEAVRLLREAKGLPHYPLDKEGNRTNMKKLYAGETARGMLSPEEREKSAIKGLQTQTQIARFLGSETRAAWLMEGLVMDRTDD
eukprot:7100572-Karenia_brevis.AAC.1